MKLPLYLLAGALLLLLPGRVQALTVRVSAQALQRTLGNQLFNRPGGRYYLRGGPGSGCSVYAEVPSIRFKNDRVLVHITTHGKLGSTFLGSCLGVSVNVETDVSLVPEAQGETIGFRDPRIESLGASKQFEALLGPFLSRRLPQEMKVNAARLVRQLLSRSPETTGYALQLQDLSIRSMRVQGDALVFDLDGALDVH